MSVLDKIKRREMDMIAAGDQTSQDSSSTPITAEILDPPVVTRIRLVMNQLANFTRTNGRNSEYARFAWVAVGLVEEIVDEMTRIPPEKLQTWFADFGRIIEWCGTGDDTVLPDELREWVHANYPKELQAIEA